MNIGGGGHGGGDVEGEEGTTPCPNHIKTCLELQFPLTVITEQERLLTGKGHRQESLASWKLDSQK